MPAGVLNTDSDFASAPGYGGPAGLGQKNPLRKSAASATFGTMPPAVLPVIPPSSHLTPDRQPWIRSAGFDGGWILAPPFLALLAVAALPPALRTGSQMPLWAWVSLVVLIDVAHVYSTLFRTYFDRARRRQEELLRAVRRSRVRRCFGTLALAGP